MNLRRLSQAKTAISITSILICVLFLVVQYNGLALKSHFIGSPAWSSTQTANGTRVEIVVASMKHEDASWIARYLPNWARSIYVVDDPHAELTVVENKGREAMVYLTYLIDRYESLPENVVFIHAGRFQWHNDDPDYDALRLLQHINFEYLQKVGYANLRCAWVLGCPVEIRPFEDETSTDHRTTSHVFKKAFQELFPNEAVPEAVGVPCCAQFGVSRDAIRQRSKEFYTKVRQWLLDTELPSDVSGRVLEYSWHILFGQPAVRCPDAPECYCGLYGLCDLSCEQDHCGERYSLPKFSNLPEGWPKLGWDGEERSFSGPL